MKNEISAIDRQQEIKRIDRKLTWLRKKEKEQSDYIRSDEFSRKLKRREYAHKKYGVGLFHLKDQPEYKEIYRTRCAIRKWERIKIDLYNKPLQSFFTYEECQRKNGEMTVRRISP